MVPGDNSARVRQTPVTALLEDVLGCKWSWSVLQVVHAGTVRPGQIERAIPGISTKVLNERLKKLVANGVLEKAEFAEAMPHVEYAFTALGRKFLDVLERLDALERERAQAVASEPAPAKASRPPAGS